jgi:amino acid transporter
VAGLGSVAKRLLIGRPYSTGQASEQLLPKRIALPIFASDPLSSVAYATEEILLVLGLGGIALLHLSVPAAVGVVVLLAVVVTSYRQTVFAYPRGGGAYQVAGENLGRPFGLVAASALLTDYVLTVAVSVSAGVDNIASAIPGLHAHQLALALGFVTLLAIGNLRGIRESGRAFAAPTYCFVAGVLVMVGWGLLRSLFGDTPQAESAGLPVNAEHSYAGLALVFLGLRAFSSGCTALTGVEAIANGVPAFRPPKSANAARTLLVLGVLAITMFTGITALALLGHVHVAADPQDLGLPAGADTKTVIAQIAAAVFGGDHSIGFFWITAFTALVLVLAANTAFNGFPLLGSILAQDRYAPRQLHTRGDRLVYSNGIVVLAVAAGLLIYAFDASTTRLIQLYIIGVFLSFTLSQAGMVRHWTRTIATESDPRQRRAIRRKRAVNAVGAAFTGIVLVIVLATKFLAGAWIVVIAMPLLYLLMTGIHRHYGQVSKELEWRTDAVMLPSRNQAVVVVSRLHLPTARALAYARATRPDTLTALTVNVDDADTRQLQEDWRARRISVPLTVLESPYREITRPVLRYVRELRRAGPRDVVTVFIPEYVLGRWWEQLLHNQSALRLKARLLFQPGVMVTSVPWQLHSALPIVHRAAAEEGVEPVGSDLAGDGATPVGDGATPVGDGVTSVGTGATPVGDGATPVHGSAEEDLVSGS